MHSLQQISATCTQTDAANHIREAFQSHGADRHFFLFGKAFQLYIDELFKYKSGDMIANKSFDVLYRTFMSSWGRFFGPPIILKTDQEGALAGTEFATVCDRLMIQLMLAGSTEKHTVTGTVERYISIVKSIMLKVHSKMISKGMSIDFGVLFQEACVATNCLLTHNGVCPAIGVSGQLPRDFLEVDNNSPANDVMLPGEACSDAIIVRHIAKASTLQAVLERRLAMANNTRPHQAPQEKGVPGTQVDLRRQPERKDIPGWRGPAVVMDVTQRQTMCQSSGKAEC